MTANVLEGAREIRRELECFIKEAEDLQLKRAGIHALHGLKTHLQRAGCFLDNGPSGRQRASTAALKADRFGKVPSIMENAAIDDGLAQADAEQLRSELQEMESVRDRRRSELADHLRHSISPADGAPQMGLKPSEGLGAGDDVVRQLGNQQLQLLGHLESAQYAVERAEAEKVAYWEQSLKDQAELRSVKDELQAVCAGGRGAPDGGREVMWQNKCQNQARENDALKTKLDISTEEVRTLQEMSTELGNKFEAERQSWKEKQALEQEFVSLQKQGHDADAADIQARLDREISDACKVYSGKLADMKRMQEGNAALCTELEEALAAQTASGGIRVDAATHLRTAASAGRTAASPAAEDELLAGASPIDVLCAKVGQELGALSQWSANLCHEVDPEQGSSDGIGPKLRTEFDALAKWSLNFSQEMDAERDELRRWHGQQASASELKLADVQAELYGEVERAQQQCALEAAEVRRLQLESDNLQTKLTREHGIWQEQLRLESQIVEVSRSELETERGARSPHRLPLARSGTNDSKLSVDVQKVGGPKASPRANGKAGPKAAAKLAPGRPPPGQRPRGQPFGQPAVVDEASASELKLADVQAELYGEVESAQQECASEASPRPNGRAGPKAAAKLAPGRPPQGQRPRGQPFGQPAARDEASPLPSPRTASPMQSSRSGADAKEQRTNSNNRLRSDRPPSNQASPVPSPRNSPLPSPRGRVGRADSKDSRPSPRQQTAGGNGIARASGASDAMQEPPPPMKAPLRPASPATAARAPNSSAAQPASLPVAPQEQAAFLDSDSDMSSFSSFGSDGQVRRRSRKSTRSSNARTPNFPPETDSFNMGQAQDDQSRRTDQSRLDQSRRAQWEEGRR